MPEDGRLREVAWREVFPWLHLFRTWRIALQLRLMVLAAAGFLAMAVGWQAIARVFSGTDNPQTAARLAAYRWFDVGGQHLAAPPHAPSWALPSITWQDTLWFSAWHWLSTPFRQLFEETSATSLAVALLCLLWSLIVWAFFGGAITRLASLELARRQRAALGDALRYARRKWLSYFAAPLFPLIGVLLLSLPLVIGGLVMRTNFGVFLAGLGWPLAVGLGFLLMLLVVGVGFGWPLMWPAISIEVGSDSFDALSRSYSYVFQRPLHYLGYAVVIALVGGIAGTIVNWLIDWIAFLPVWAVSWGSGGQRGELLFAPGNDAPLLLEWGSALIRFWTWLLRSLKFGYLFSFFWTASSAAYLLLRLETDGTELDEIHIDEPVDTGPMPELTKDAAGVPVVREPGTSDAGPEGSPQAETEN